MTRRTRILSLLLALLMLATLLPLNEMGLVTRVEAKDYNLTIDFDYATTNGVTNLSDALRLAGDNGSTYRKQGDGLSPAIDENYYKSNYNEFKWKHVWTWTCRDLKEGSIRTYLASTDPADKYICLENDNDTEYHARTRWEPIKITTDKVLDLNGHYIDIRYYRNRNNSSKTKEQNKVDLSTHNCWAFEIEEGATLTIIDSSAWRGEGKTRTGTGRLSFTGYLVDPYKYEIWTYCTRDLFRVNNGNLVIYGGTFQAGRKRDQMKSNFSWTKLTNVIGQAVELGVGVAEYATGIGVATEKYQNLLQQQMNLSALQEKSDTGEDDGSQGSTQTMLPRTGSDDDKGEKPATEKKEDTPAQAGDSKKDTGRNQTVDEKKQTKDQNIDNGKPGTKEGQNKENKKGNGKDDSKTSLAQAQENVVKQALDKSKVTGMVTGVIDLVQGIAGLFGSDPKTRVTQAIQGTVVRVGNNGSFVAYGGTFQGYGSTPNTRNAVVEVNVVPGTTKPSDHSKTQGGVAYIYGGTFEAYNGANVFNMIRFNETQYALQYTRNEYGVLSQPTRVPLSTNETGGVEVYYYDNQSEVANDTTGKVVPIPVNTSNVQVRGGVFRCFYDLVNVATLPEEEDDNFAKFVGTMGSVNLGIESFNSDLIYDGRIQIVDKYGDGALVLLDDRADEVGDYEGLYHYRLFCGDTELRYKSYLEVYPNNADTNTSHSMQLSTYVGNGKQTSLLFADDQENDRTPYRQTENYFDYMFDDTGANAWSVMPNFHFQATDTDAEKMDALQSDVYGERLNNSEVWYYPEPLTASGKPIGDVPYGEAGFTGVLHGAGSTTFNISVSQRFATDGSWKSMLKVADPSTIKYYAEKHDGVRETLRFFTYRIYRVDPLTRENLSESDVFGEDEPLIEVRYGAGSNDALKCKLPLKTVEQQIKDRRPDWKGYQQGEMYRIVLDVEEVVAAGYQGNGLWGQKLKTAKSQSTILFRCFSVKEQKSEQGQLYNAHDYTPLQWQTNRKLWSINDDGQLFFQAGNTANVSFVNAKTGMTDYRGDTRVFDVYYQWWEVKADGTPVRMIAGTDFLYDPKNGAYDDHRFSSWNVAGDNVHTFVNTVDPNDPNAAGYTYHGLPGKSNGQPDPTKWKDYQLHAYIAGSTDVTKLTRDGSENLHLGNNRIFQDNYDLCYIPEDMAGKYLQVKAVVQNVRWPMAFDSRQTFYSHVVKVREAPAQPLTGTLNAAYTGDMAYGTYDKPVTLSLSDITGLGSGETISSVYYYAGGNSKEFTGLKVTDPDDLPTVKYPADFYASGYNLQKVGTNENKQMFAQYTTSKGRTFDTGISTFNYQKTATSISRIGDEVQTIQLSDLRNGKYENGMLAFLVMPSGATVGYDFTKFTSTNPDVATLDQRGYVLFGKVPGEATISGKSPDGKTVSVTFRVIDKITYVDVAELAAPAVGQKFDRSVTVPDGIGYHVKEVKWYEITGRFSSTELTANATAEYFKPYRVEVILEPDAAHVFERSNLSYDMEIDEADGSVTTNNGIYSIYNNDVYLQDDGNLALYYNFGSLSDHAAAVIDRIYMDFPAEVAEGTNINEWMEQFQISTNGYDEGFEFEIIPSYSGDAYDAAYAHAEDIGSTIQIQTFMQNVQTGFAVHIKIPEELGNVGDKFSNKNDIKIIVNGEETGTVTNVFDDEIWLAAPDTLTVTAGPAAPVMPIYSIDGANAIVGQTIDINELLHCDDPRVSVQMTEIQFDSDWDTYFSYDYDAGTFTPKKASPPSSIWLYFDVIFDADGDGRPEYVEPKSLLFHTIYANASEAPAIENVRTIQITALDPEENEVYTGSYQYLGNKVQNLSIPEIDNAFIAGIYDESGTSLTATYASTLRLGANRITANFKNGKSYTVKTVDANDLTVSPGPTYVYAFAKDEEGRDVFGINLSVDGEHYYCSDHLTGLEPNTEYTLYYRQGVDGQVYTKSFRTANKEYGVVVGRTPVTDANFGNLERDGWHYDPDANVLTLKDLILHDTGAVATVDSFYAYSISERAAIASSGALTVKLIGQNELANYGSGAVNAAIFAEEDLTIIGNGNLSVIAGDYALFSNAADINLNSTGLIDIQNTSYAFGTFSGKVNYSNSEIDFKAKIQTIDGTNYQTGSLVPYSDPDIVDFSKKEHSITISAASANGNYRTISETELPELIKKNRTASNPEISIRIVPAHSDVKKVATADYLKSGDCTKASTYYYSCACGHVSSNTFTQAAGAHELIHHEAKPATCVSDGWDAYDTCANCSYSTFQAIPALGHDWVHHDQKDPTCEENGYPDYDECSRCGLSSKLEIPDSAGPATRAISAAQNTTGEIVNPEILKWCATGHNYVSVAGDAPSCTAAGTADHYVCANCGGLALDKDGVYPAAQADLKLDALGHAWSPWEIVDGKEVHTCERCGETAEKKDNPFEDVKEGAFYFDPVLWAVAHNPQITAGVSATRFAPGNTCTRAQVVTFLWRAKGQPEPTKTDNPFTDVSPSAYYYKAVLWAVENNITAGVSKDRFAPNNGCTRGQVVTFLWRTEGQPEPGSSTNPFTDVPTSAYYYKAVLWAVNHQPQITAGVSKDRFAPGNTCTRGQIVTFLYRDLK